ncbi:MAG: OmpH family outer membrane protein [Candidatus Adiutrix sp.]|jgi:outer membrane protein|nr:OmpH family outer membrane protein [Candidatus Adiutrix sp.]
MKKVQVKIGLLAALALVVLSLPVMAEAQQGQFPIAVVDVNRVFRDSKAGQKIDKGLKDKGVQMEKDMKAKDGNLKKMYEDLIKEAQSGKSTKEVLEKKESDLKAKIDAFQKERSDAIEKMNRDADSAIKPLQTKTEQAIEKLAKDKGYVVVLNSQGVVYSPNSIDITQDVIAAVDK